MATTSWKFCRRAAGGWSGTNNITAEDAVNADWAMGAGNATAVLVGDDFGFTDEDIPVGSTITGIEARIKVSRWPYVVAVQRFSLRKVVSTNVGDNKAGSFPTIAQSLTKYTLGGAADLWGTTWSEADVKAAGFGVAFQVSNPDGKYSTTCYVDCIEARIHFTPPVSAPVVTANSASAIAGVGGTVQMAATNTPTSWSLPGSPPTGVSINSSGLVTWTTATPAGVYSITVRATNAGGNGDGTLTLTITAAGHIRRALLGVG